MHIVQGRRQQDGIVVARFDRKSTEALWKDGGERKEGSPTYLRIVGRKRKEKRNTAPVPNFQWQWCNKVIVVSSGFDEPALLERHTLTFMSVFVMK